MISHKGFLCTFFYICHNSYDVNPYLTNSIIYIFLAYYRLCVLISIIPHILLFKVFLFFYLSKISCPRCSSRQLYYLQHPLFSYKSPLFIIHTFFHIIIVPHSLPTTIPAFYNGDTLLLSSFDFSRCLLNATFF